MTAPDVRWSAIVIAETIIAWHEGLSAHVFHNDFELIYQKQRLPGFLGQHVDPLLHGGNAVRMSVGKVVFLGRIVSQIVQIDA